MTGHYSRAHPWHRRPIIAILACIGTIGFGVSVNPGRAEAATYVNSNITSSTTWTTAGSPYILQTWVSVTAGATLTIKPGVTVEFDGAPSLSLGIIGTIKSIGTAAKPIVFTSAQGVAGQGAPGQYEGVNVQDGASSQFSYTTFEYGGWGTGGYYAYGALEVGNVGTQVSIDHSVFEHNEYSGLDIIDGTVSVTYSTFADNGNGISQIVSQIQSGQLTLSDSTVSNNLNDGLFFNEVSDVTTPGSTIKNNLITMNGGNGIDMLISCSTPAGSWPHGNQNDIYANGATSDPADGSELYTLYVCHAIHVDWTGNYWGNVQWDTGPTALESPPTCDGDGPPEDWYEVDSSVQPLGYLAYTDWSDREEPPVGPISTAYTTLPHGIICPNGDPENESYDYVYNSIYLQPGQISTSYIPIP